MNLMRQWKFTLLILAAVLWMPTSEGFASSKVDLLSLPQGDAGRGREVFIALKCNTCHEVAGDKNMQPPSTISVGPVFGVRQSRYKANFIADSIIFPSHAIQPGSKGKSAADGLSRMGDFSDSITIRQLADVVAYLKTLDDEI